MRRSQQIAAAVALKALGRKVVLRPIGALVEDVAAGTARRRQARARRRDHRRQRQARDRRRTEVSATTSKGKIGGIVTFTIRRDGKTLLETMRTVAGHEPAAARSSASSSTQPATDIHLPIQVSIDAGNIGGPSAGLAFALEVMEKLGRDVVHGHKIAATGEIFPDGSIGPIGGIKQKVIGAREAGVDAFLVPAGENASDARKDAHGLRSSLCTTFNRRCMRWQLCPLRRS